MFLLIATVFIAELIIALTLVFFINKADRAIVKCNEVVIEKQKELDKTLKELKSCVTNFGVYYNCMLASVKKKRNQFRINMLKNILMYLSLFLLKGKYKKLAATVQFAVLFHDYLMKIRSE